MSATVKPHAASALPHRRWISTATGLVVSAGLLYWVMRPFELAQIGKALEEARWIYLIPILGIFGSGYTLRTLRWRALFPQGRTLSFRHLFVALMSGYLVNNLFPARAGELARIFVLGQRAGVAKSMVLATIVVERVGDLLMIVILLAVCLGSFPVPPALQGAGMAAALLALTALAVLIVAAWSGEAGRPHWLERMPLLPPPLKARSLHFAEAFASGASALRSLPHLLRFVGFTLAVWTCETSVIWVSARAFHIPLLPGEAVFVLLAVALGAMVPASPGYVGTYEFFALQALALLDIHDAKALSCVLVIHLVAILTSSTVGCIGLLCDRKRGEPPFVKFWRLKSSNSPTP